MPDPLVTKTAQTNGARDLFQSGRLADSLQSALGDVKAKPADIPARRLLCELLCFAGDLDKADGQLDTIGKLDSKAMFDASLHRQFLRAELARRDFHTAGRLPEFLDQPSDELKLRLEASIALRENRSADAVAALQKAEQLRPRIRGTSNDQPFEDFRDLDDLTASFLEVLTSTGKYFWIPLDKVELIEFNPPERIRDLLWRKAHMSVRGGPDGEVYLPVLYAGSHTSSDDQVRLGRATDWTSDAPIRGVGQRTFLVGEDDVSIMELTTLQFNQSAG